MRLPRGRAVPARRFRRDCPGRSHAAAPTAPTARAAAPPVGRLLPQVLRDQNRNRVELALPHRPGRRGQRPRLHMDRIQEGLCHDGPPPHRLRALHHPREQAPLQRQHHLARKARARVLGRLGDGLARAALPGPREELLPHQGGLHRAHRRRRHVLRARTGAGGHIVGRGPHGGQRNRRHEPALLDRGRGGLVLRLRDPTAQPPRQDLCPRRPRKPAGPVPGRGPGADPQVARQIVDQGRQPGPLLWRHSDPAAAVGVPGPVLPLCEAPVLEQQPKPGADVDQHQPHEDLLRAIRDQSFPPGGCCCAVKLRSTGRQSCKRCWARSTSFQVAGHTVSSVARTPSPLATPHTANPTVATVTKRVLRPPLVTATPATRALAASPARARACNASACRASSPSACTRASLRGNDAESASKPRACSAASDCSPERWSMEALEAAMRKSPKKARKRLKRRCAGIQKGTQGPEACAGMVSGAAGRGRWGTHRDEQGWDHEHSDPPQAHVDVEEEGIMHGFPAGLEVPVEHRVELRRARIGLRPRGRTNPIFAVPTTGRRE
ncbi:hypothetical protein DFJ74DRAFT_735507 [Hyaloraphidium curvatum]|nr:hypothetical protein DFJ74DRAFT_735507 [Hyaloraphidium curvatum]